MSQRFTRKQVMLAALLSVMILAFSLAQPAAAQVIVYGNSVPADTELDQNLILTGYNVTIDGTVNGDVMAFGTRVTVNGVVNGSLVTAAEYININGQVTGSIYSSALLLSLGPAAKITRDLFFLGVQLNLQQGCLIERDLYTLSLLSASFAGKVNRNIYAEIGPSAILQFIFDLAGWQLPNWLGSGYLPSSGLVEYAAQSPAVLLTGAAGSFHGAGAHILMPATLTSWGGQSGYLLRPSLQIDPVLLRDWGLDLLRDLTVLLVVGLFSVWLVPALLNRSSGRLRADALPSVGWGLVVYLLGWFLFGLLFTLIIALAIFFLTITFVSLGFVVGGVGLASLSLAFSLFCVCVFYVSKIVVALFFGRLLLGLVSKKAATLTLVPMLLGIVLYALLASVPYLGFVVSTVVTFFGLGALWLSLRPVKEIAPVSVAIEDAAAFSTPTEEPMTGDGLQASVEAPEVEPIAEGLSVKTKPLPPDESLAGESSEMEKPARRRKKAPQ